MSEHILFLHARKGSQASEQPRPVVTGPAETLSKILAFAKWLREYDFDPCFRAEARAECERKGVPVAKFETWLSQQREALRMKGPGA